MNAVTINFKYLIKFSGTRGLPIKYEGQPKVNMTLGDFFDTELEWTEEYTQNFQKVMEMPRIEQGCFSMKKGFIVSEQYGFEIQVRNFTT